MIRRRDDRPVALVGQSVAAPCANRLAASACGAHRRFVVGARHRRWLCELARAPRTRDRAPGSVARARIRHGESITCHRDEPQVRGYSSTVSGAEAHATTERYVRHGGLNAQVLSELDQPPTGDRAMVLRETGELVGLAGLVPAFGPFDQLRDDAEAPEHLPAPALNRIEMACTTTWTVVLDGVGMRRRRPQPWSTLPSRA